MTSRTRIGYTLYAAFLFVLASTYAHGEETQTLLRITSPVAGTVVIEGQPLRITVSADVSVRMVGIIPWDPLPNPRPVGNNQFEMLIPKTVAPGKYLLTAVGLTSTDIESEPVEIQVEREDPAIALRVQPPLLSFHELGDKFPLSVIATFSDGSHLDVTRSIKTSFAPKDSKIVTVGNQGIAAAVGPGQTSIIVRYGATTNPVEADTLYSAVMVYSPRPKPTGPAPEILSVTPETGVPGVTEITIRGRHFGESQAMGYVCIGTHNGIVKSWRDDEIIAIVPERTRMGSIYVEQGELSSNVIEFIPVGLFIDAVLDKFVPGGQIRVLGSGFGSERGSGYVNVGDAKAAVSSWNNTQITLTVPETVVPAKSYVLSVHQNDKSAELRGMVFQQ